MKKTLAIILASVLLSYSSSQAGEIAEWEPVQDGNMIVTVRSIDKDGVHLVQYKYNIKSPPVRRGSCDEVQYIPQQNEIWLMTQSAKPWVYIISSKYNAYKPEGHDWIGVDPLGQNLR